MAKRRKTAGKSETKPAEKIKDLNEQMPEEDSELNNPIRIDEDDYSDPIAKRNGQSGSAHAAATTGATTIKGEARSTNGLAGKFAKAAFITAGAGASLVRLVEDKKIEACRKDMEGQNKIISKNEKGARTGDLGSMIRANMAEMTLEKEKKKLSKHAKKEAKRRKRNEMMSNMIGGITQISQTAMSRNMVEAVSANTAGTSSGQIPNSASARGTEFDYIQNPQSADNEMSK